MQKKLIVFDLDGTLAKSKSPMDCEMASLLQELLKKKSVAVISGGSYSQYQKQFLASLNCKDESLLKNLFLFPTCSTAFYRFEDEWKKVYAQELSKEEKEKIFNAFEEVFMQIGFVKETRYGEIVEDRGSQITFSALGQQAPLELKKGWDPDSKKRLVMIEKMKKYIPEFEIKIGGTTSIDVTRQGIDKRFGIQQIEKQLGIKKEEILYIGDALFEGGNDYPVKQMGVDCIAVDSPEDTKKVIREIIS
ncbi:MAG: HAD-IIB family hydrolase [Candidatus Nanoarchaeia archaeon]|nr:HAD-IIB family hydrolase [Candidatus Nanoarchaeia archaeon]